MKKSPKATGRVDILMKTHANWYYCFLFHNSPVLVQSFKLHLFVKKTAFFKQLKLGKNRKTVTFSVLPSKVMLHLVIILFPVDLLPITIMKP